MYALLAEASKRSKWMPELRWTDAAPGPVQEGDRFNGESSLLFHDFFGTSQVVDAKPGQRLEEHVVIGAHFTSTWALERDGDSRTTVRHSIVVHYPAGPFSGLERWVLRRRLSRMQRRGMRRLARKTPADC